MKIYPHFLISFILLSFATWFVGCSDDSLVDSSKKKPDLVIDDGNVTTLPEPQFDTPGEEWVGVIISYRLTFEEVQLSEPDENGTLVPVELDHPELHLRSSSTPYSGAIIRLYSNGEPEFTGYYENGLLEGVARWWYSDGTPFYSHLVKGGMNIEDDSRSLDDFEDNRAEILTKVQASGKDFGASTNVIFIGDNDLFDQFTMVSKEGDRLLDERSRNLVTGAFKINDHAGRLTTYSEYKDGKRHGRQESWHENGMKSTESSFVSGLKHGVEIWRSDNGRKTWEVNYSNGKQHGVETAWDEEGQMLYQRRHQNGEMVETIYER